MASPSVRKALSVIVLATAAAACTQTEFDAVFASVDASVRLAHFQAFSDAMYTLNVTFETTYQLAAFLGAVNTNTHGLTIMEAVCAQSGTCDPIYNTRCNANATSALSYHPRSPMLVAYRCGYEEINAVIQRLSVVGGIVSIVDQPDLIASNLLYAYLAALAVWVDVNSQQESCMTMTANLTGLPQCILRTNPWECTADGQHDFVLHINNVRAAAAALGAPVSDSLLSIITNCDASSRVEATTPAPPAADDCVCDVNATTPDPTPATTVAAVTPAPTPAATVAAVTPAPTPAATVAAATPAPTPAATVAAATPMATTQQCTNATEAPTTSPDCACNDCNADYPAAGNRTGVLAAGIVSLSDFAAFFGNASATVDVSAHFNAFASAFEMANVTMDRNQASFFLGYASTVTMNLSVLGNVSASSSSDYSARGVVGLSGAAMYDSFSKFAAAAGVPCSVIAQPTLVAENLLLSYLSGAFMMVQASWSGRSTMALADAGEFGGAVAAMNNNHCPMLQQQLAIMLEVHRASALFGTPIPCVTIENTVCNNAVVSGVSHIAPTAVIVTALAAIAALA